MALPTIITVSEDAMRNCPRSMREASLALGCSKWQTIYKIVIPYSISGITSAVVLGIGRAVGETMAVLMVTGNSAVIATSILQPLRTIPATIAAELGEAPAGGVHYQALFLLGIILFVITQIINSSVEYVSAKNKIIIMNITLKKRRSQHLAFGIVFFVNLFHCSYIDNNTCFYYHSWYRSYQLGVFKHTPRPTAEPRRHISRHSRYLLPDSRQCHFCFPHRDYEWYLYERICSQREISPFYPNDDQ
jgi:ABC-type amino acid transport system permease subunit